MKNMTEEARTARNAYHREYMKANPEKRREYQKRYWERKGEALKQDAEPKKK